MKKPAAMTTSSALFERGGCIAPTEPSEFVGEPLHGNVSRALAEMAEDAADKPAVRFRAGLAEVGEAARGP